MKTHSPFRFLVTQTAALIGLCAFVSVANAQFILNGSFETNAPATWNTNAPTSWGVENTSFFWVNGTVSTPVASFNAQDGNAYAGIQRSAANSVQGVLKQNITNLTEGESYSVSFWTRARSTDSQNGTWTVSVRDSSGVLGTLSGNPINGTWTEYSFTFIATSEIPVLRLAFTNNGTGDRTCMFDNVTVSLVQVPEPATVALLTACGAILFAVIVRRRRQQN
ncbi:carbohydrate binding domain-containing protein [Geminisphaera colitermitum]|uniref:carbohydrate binding domain-containing protein n=1 Tax=Geminisphaera colitermitum TaxID=1148786 RepID=UPI000158CE02|nr:carbohydrate binding domain-containing protein [Geminisphaera colitermitum]